MSNNSSHYPEVYLCSTSTYRLTIGSAFMFTKTALLVPLFTFILYLGAQKWKQQRSFRTSSHSDIFTYHQAAFVVFLVLSSGLYLCSTISPLVSYFVFNMNLYGENYFQVLICVEQYLAVVHPIVYRGLRNARGVRIRNISIGCAWLLTLATSAFVSGFLNPQLPILTMVPFAVCLVVVSFCCLSVLRVLISPGPGEGTRVDQSKQRAFNTITAIFLVLALWLGGILISLTFYTTLTSLRFKVRCLLVVSGFWFNLPSGLVLPLLYLHRAGKLTFCCQSNG